MSDRPTDTRGLAAPDGMACDLETGLCGPAPADAPAAGLEPIRLARPAPKAKLFYVTDPICSHCWALEPVLRRFEDAYAPHLDVRVVMGGLLPSWDGFADRANGIGGPADVGGHWREVGEASRMPIDGSLWTRDPVTSSYPPSRVFVVLRERDPEAARTFLRRAREAVFAFDRNVADGAVLVDLLDELGLDGHAVLAEAEGERGHALLRRDLELARELGARGFPTLVLADDAGRGVKVVGARSLASYVEALEAVLGDAAPEPAPLPPLRELLRREGRLFAKEVEAYYDLAPEAFDAFVRDALPADAYRRRSVLGEPMLESA